MEQIQPVIKTLTRYPGERKTPLLLTVPWNRYLVCTAIPIIFGIETYYGNYYGDQNTFYLGGFWSILYGLLCLIAYLRYRNATKATRMRTTTANKPLEETVHFSEQCFSYSKHNSVKFQTTWDSVAKFKIGKRHIQLCIAGTEFLLSKKYFTTEEINQIQRLITHIQSNT